MRPAVGAFAEELYAALEPLAYDDEHLGWPLLSLCAAFGDPLFQEIEDLARDTAEGPGWSSLLDVDRAPADALGYLAQFVGVTIPPGLTDAAQRDRIAATDGMSRGKVTAIVGAAQQRLTGSKTVILRERDPNVSPTAPAYGLTVITFTGETPDPVATEADIRAQKPAGIKLAYTVLAAQDFEQVRDTYTTFNDLRVAYTDFDEMRTDTP